MIANTWNIFLRLFLTANERYLFFETKKKNVIHSRYAVSVFDKNKHFYWPFFFRFEFTYTWYSCFVCKFFLWMMFSGANAHPHEIFGYIVYMGGWRETITWLLIRIDVYRQSYGNQPSEIGWNIFCAETCCRKNFLFLVVSSVCVYSVQHITDHTNRTMVIRWLCTSVQQND